MRFTWLVAVVSFVGCSDEPFCDYQTPLAEIQDPAGIDCADRPADAAYFEGVRTCIKEAIANDRPFVALRHVDNGVNIIVKNAAHLYTLHYFHDDGAGGENFQEWQRLECTGLADISSCSTLEMQQGFFCFGCIAVDGSKETCNSD